VRAPQARWPITTQCRVLGVSTGGYYAWPKRAPSQRRRDDVVLGDRIELHHRQSRYTYGRPRIQADLRDAQIHVSDRRVARLMRDRTLQGASWRRAFKTTIRDKEARPAPDLVNRQFTAATPDRLWSADIAHMPTMTGFLFLAVVLDVFSRRVVGWAMVAHMRAELVVNALDLALYRRKSSGVTHNANQDRSTPRSRLASAARAPACIRPWGRLAIATISQCARASMRR